MVTTPNSPTGDDASVSTDAAPAARAAGAAAGTADDIAVAVRLDVSFRPRRWRVEATVSHARASLPDLLEQVRDGGVVYLTRYGRRLAALVPAEAAEQLERLTDEYWSRRAREALTADEPSIPWTRVVAELESRR